LKILGAKWRDLRFLFSQAETFRRVWSRPVLDFRDDGGHGEDPCGQDVSPQKRIDQGALAAFHLAENRKMKLVGYEFLFEAEQPFAQAFVAQTGILNHEEIVPRRFHR
jgi:hypothetical protein